MTPLFVPFVLLFMNHEFINLEPIGPPSDKTHCQEVLEHKAPDAVETLPEGAGAVFGCLPLPENPPPHKPEVAT